MAGVFHSSTSHCRREQPSASGDGGDVREQRFADSLPAVFGANEEIFNVDAGVAAPGGVVVEVEGETDGDDRAALLELGDDAIEAFGFAEAVAEKIGLRGVDGVGLALVLREVANELQNLRNVGGRGGAEIEPVVLLR